jgi:hypothetical protein
MANTNEEFLKGHRQINYRTKDSRTITLTPGFLYTKSCIKIEYEKLLNLKNINIKF